MARKHGLLMLALRIIVDAVLSAVSFFVAVYLATNFFPGEIFLKNSISPCIFYTVFIIALNVLFRTYSFKFVHVSIIEALRVILVSVAWLAVILILHVTGLYTYHLPTSLIYLILYTLVSEMYRFSFRSTYVFRKLFGLYGSGGPPKHVLVISDRDKAGLILRRLLQGQQLKFRPVAVLTDEAEGDKKILGVRVYTNPNELGDIIRRCSIDEIVLLADYYNARRTSGLKRLCNSMGVDIKVFQSLTPIDKSGENSFRKLNLEDLLGRNEIKLEKTWIEAFITGKRVLVTGAAGSIGSEICRQCLSFGCKSLYLLDIDENGLFELEIELNKLAGGADIVPIVASIRDAERLDSVFGKYSPEVCFHAAAHKHVPMMEKNPCEAMKNNIFGTLNILKVCDAEKVKKLIVISSDKAVNPSSVMGATKRVTEILVQAYGKTMSTEAAAVRFGNVLGSNGSVIPLFQKQIEEGGPVTLTHRNMERYFMTISEAVQLVLQTGALATRGEIFVFDMGRSMKIYDLAVELIRLAGLEPGKDIEIKETGLRPGEKLFEELRLDSENMDGTKHRSIFVCKPMSIDRAWLDRQLDHLKRALYSEDERSAIDCLFALVPSVYRKPTIGTLNIQSDVLEVVQ